MPSAWSNKRERQYKKIQKSEKAQGRSTATAKRIAAATVNKTRKAKGETKGGTRSRKKSTAARSSRSTRSTASRKRTTAARKAGKASARAK